MEWINPHGWIYVDVKEAGRHGRDLGGRDRRAERAAAARPAEDRLPDRRRGARSRGYLAKNGKPIANGRTVTFPDGRDFFFGSSGTGAPRTARTGPRRERRARSATTATRWRARPSLRVLVADGAGARTAPAAPASPAATAATRGRQTRSLRHLAGAGAGGLGHPGSSRARRRAGRPGHRGRRRDPLSAVGAGEAEGELRRTRHRSTPRRTAICPGVPRLIYMPFPFQIVQTPELVLMFTSTRARSGTIHTDGTEHPHGPIEWWLGDSRGRWEGDTLVVDTCTSRPDLVRSRRQLPQRGAARRRALHARRPRPHHATSATLEDPKVFTRPWDIETVLYRRKETQRAAARVQLLRVRARGAVS